MTNDLATFNALFSVCDCDNHKRFATDEFDDWGLFDGAPFDYGDDDWLDDYDYTEGDIGQDGEI